MATGFIATSAAATMGINKQVWALERGINDGGDSLACDCIDAKR